MYGSLAELEKIELYLQSFGVEKIKTEVYKMLVSHN